MTYRLALGAICATCLVAAAGSASPAREETTPMIVALDALQWRPTPIRGVDGATIVGNPGKGGLYAVYAKYAAGVRSPPHSHPDTRIVTVVSGTFYAGAGTEFDASKTQALKPGMTIVVPARAPHFGWAKDGQVILQEVGVGPTGIDLVGRNRH
jgi:quercetin dioxygenase-like cupin family protein